MGFTAYPNGVSSFGIPQMGEGIPSTYGEYIFVDPAANGRGTGKNMKDAFLTAGEADTASTTNKHDVILMNAVGAHSSVATTNDELAISKSRVHYVGLGGGSRYFGQRTRWTMGVTTGTAIAVVKNTGVGNTFTNIKFDSADTLGTSLYAFADGGEYTQMTACEIVHSGHKGTSDSAPLLCNSDSGYYKHCMIGSLDYQMTTDNYNVLCNRETISGKVARDVVFDDCLFFLNTTSTSTGSFSMSGATDVERIMLFTNCLFYNALLSTNNPADVFVIGAAQTGGEIILRDCRKGNITGWSDSTSLGVFYAGDIIADSATTSGTFLDMGG